MMLARLEVPIPDGGFRYRLLPGGRFSAHHIRWSGIEATGESTADAAARLVEAIEQSLMMSIADALKLSQQEMDPN